MALPAVAVTGTSAQQLLCEQVRMKGIYSGASSSCIKSASRRLLAAVDAVQPAKDM
jgi:hypothetical protein